MDAPDHPKYRALTQGWFMPANLTKFEARVRAIASAKVNGDYLPPHDITSYYMIVATAGHDTTSSSTAGALWALAQDPQQFARVKANPELIPGLIDEAIRWMTPVKHFMRSATADTELGGRRIAKGD